jgi:hypothetical protein
MYVIVKFIKNKKTNKYLPVILLNTQSEIWEFKTKSEAEQMKDVFEKNSDSGYIYDVKKIG